MKKFTVAGCAIYRGFIMPYEEMVALDFIRENIDFPQHGSLLNQLAPVVIKGDVVYNCKELSGIVHDLTLKGKLCTRNYAFVQKVLPGGEPAKFWPPNNIDNVILTAIGDFEGGEFNVGGHIIGLNPTDVIEMPTFDYNSARIPYPFKIKPITKGEMYLISIHHIVK